MPYLQWAPLAPLFSLEDDLRTIAEAYIILDKVFDNHANCTGTGGGEEKGSPPFPPMCPLGEHI